MYACRQSLPVPSDLRQGLQVLHHFLPTGWLPYSWLSMSTPFVLNVLLLAQQTQLGAGSLYFLNYSTVSGVMNPITEISDFRRKCLRFSR